MGVASGKNSKVETQQASMDTGVTPRCPHSTIIYQVTTNDVNKTFFKTKTKTKTMLKHGIISLMTSPRLNHGWRLTVFRRSISRLYVDVDENTSAGVGCMLVYCCYGSNASLARGLWYTVRVASRHRGASVGLHQPLKYHICDKPAVKIC